MTSKILKYVCSFIFAVILLSMMYACAPYIDNEFVGANVKTFLPTEEPSIPPITASPSPSQEFETPTPKPSKKPGGFILSETPVETQTHINTAKPSATNEPSEPVVTSQPGGVSIKVSSGLKSALNFIGKTTVINDKIVALSTKKDNTGGLAIIFIKNGSKEAVRTTYIYYESDKDYNNAKTNADATMCNNNLRLITKETVTILPVTNPETMSIVLFDGYVIWR